MSIKFSGTDNLKVYQELYKEIPKEDLALIYNLAKMLARKSFSFITSDDLFQEGVIAYLRAKQVYDKNKNDYFMGFAFKKIKGAMLDYIGNNSFKKAKTVRQSLVKRAGESRVTVLHITDDNNYAKDDMDNLIEEIDAENLRKKFDEYVESLTDMEKYILQEYFLHRTSMSELEKRLKVSRIKLKHILVNAVAYIKKRYKMDFSSKDVQWRKISTV